MENNGEEKSYIPNRVISKEDLKTYFENGDIPDEQDFWEWQDSYWHKNDPQDVIPADRLDLSGKADKNATNLDGENVQNWRTKLNIENTGNDTLQTVINRGNHSPKNITFTGGDTGEDERDGALGMKISTYSFYFGNMNTAHTGNWNISYGYNSLSNLTSGGANVGLGHYSLTNLTTGYKNIAIGYGSGKMTTGADNVTIGNSAGFYVTNGNKNIFLGSQSGGYINGNNNIFIGTAAGRSNLSTTVQTINNRLVIHGNVSFAPNANTEQENVQNYDSSHTNGLIIGDFADRWVKFNGSFSINPTYIANAQGDATYTKNIVAKPDGTFGWEDKGIPYAFVSPVTLGGIAAGATIPKGTELLSFIQMLLNAVQYPTYSNPSQTFTNDKGIANGGIYEIGTTFSNVTFTKTYSQGIIRGKTVNGIWEATTEQGKRSGSLVSFNINGTDIGVNQSINLGDVVVTYGTNTITSATSYAKGDQPVDSMGNNFQTPLPAANPAMNISFSGVFKAFYGNTVAPTIATGTEVRLLPSANMISTLKKVILVTGNSNVNYHVFLPSSFVVTKVIDLSNSNQDITDEYELLGTFEVPDAAGTPRTYMHYRMINTAAYSTSHNHEITFN